MHEIEKSYEENTSLDFTKTYENSCNAYISPLQIEYLSPTLSAYSTPLLSPVAVVPQFHLLNSLYK